jgi:hypothetical protein
VRSQVVGVDAVPDHADAVVRDPEDVGHLLAHVEGADDHAVGAVGDPALDTVDVGLRVLVDPALVASVLRRVDRGHERGAEAPREMIAGGRHQPIVAVDEIEPVAIAELDAGGQHVDVHPLHPGDELAQVDGPRGLADAMDLNAGDLFLWRRLLPPARQHVHLDPDVDQRLAELAHVAGEAALDQRRVLPGKDQDTVRQHREAKARTGGPG